MPELEQRLGRLAADHREALQWFLDRKGQDISWPAPLESGLFLANKAKGIHKPAGWRHALSVRQNLKGPYADRDIVYGPEGAWTFEYFQEGHDIAQRDDDFTNRALMANREDGVPVAVLVQTKSKPDSRYRVMGLAAVEDWAGGYFRLQGFTDDGLMPAAVPLNATDQIVAAVDTIPVNLTDARKRVNAAIVARQGSGKFRAEVLRAFNRRCALSDCDVSDALEAAHIVPYLGPETDRVSNSLLLRADLHTLFDRGLLRIDANTLRVRLAPALAETSYSFLEGAVLRLPDGEHEPWRQALMRRYAGPEEKAPF